MPLKYILVRFNIYILFAVSISGCTYNLFEAAAGEKILIKRTPTKITKAYKKSEDEVIICLEAKDPDTELVYTYNFSIPLTSAAEHVEYKLKKIPNAYFIPRLEDVREGCNYTKNELEIIEFKIKNTNSEDVAGKMELISEISGKLPEAVYAIYRDNAPIQLGYASNTVLYSNIKYLDVPLKSVYSYTETKNSRPYLYILTPGAVLFDIQVTLPAVISLYTGYCIIGYNHSTKQCSY